MGWRDQGTCAPEGALEFGRERGSEVVLLYLNIVHNSSKGFFFFLCLCVLGCAILGIGIGGISYRYLGQLESMVAVVISAVGRTARVPHQQVSPTKTRSLTQPSHRVVTTTRSAVWGHAAKSVNQSVKSNLPGKCRLQQQNIHKRSLKKQRKRVKE